MKGSRLSLMNLRPVTWKCSKISNQLMRSEKEANMYHAQLTDKNHKYKFNQRKN